MRSNRSHLGSKHLAREPGRVNYPVVKGHVAGRSTPGYPAASMIGGMSVVMDLKDVEKEGLGSRDDRFYVGRGANSRTQ